MQPEPLTTKHVGTSVEPLPIHRQPARHPVWNEVL